MRLLTFLLWFPLLRFGLKIAFWVFRKVVLALFVVGGGWFLLRSLHLL